MVGSSRCSLCSPPSVDALSSRHFVHLQRRREHHRHSTVICPAPCVRHVPAAERLQPTSVTVPQTSGPCTPLFCVHEAAGASAHSTLLNRSAHRGCVQFVTTPLPFRIATGTAS